MVFGFGFIFFFPSSLCLMCVACDSKCMCARSRAPAAAAAISMIFGHTLTHQMMRIHFHFQPFVCDSYQLCYPLPSISPGISLNFLNTSVPLRFSWFRFCWYDNAAYGHRWWTTQNKYQDLVGLSRNRKYYTLLNVLNEALYWFYCPWENTHRDMSLVSDVESVWS